MTNEIRLAFKIPENGGYIKIFERSDDDGYDYQIYNASFQELDGGVYDDDSININDALGIICDDEGIDINTLVPVDYDWLEEAADT